MRALAAIRCSPRLVLGGGLLALFVLVAALGPAIVPYGYDDQNLAARLKPPAWVAGGTWIHPLGTDQLGRDTLTRVVHGARISLSVGFAGVMAGALGGVILGLLAGYYGGRLGDLIMRMADAQLAFPYLLLAIAIMAAVGPSLPALIAVLGLRTWVIYARTVRALVLSAREQEYVQAAVAVGGSQLRVMVRHILPNVFSPILVLATIELANLILMESTLSFLGLGVQPPVPSWGSMLSGARNYLLTSWWLVSFPGTAIMLVVLAANLLGDGLRDSLDPRSHG